MIKKQVLGVLLLIFTGGLASAHIVPPEDLHPQAESYRRLNFLLDLNPVPWDAVARDADVIGRGLRSLDAGAGDRFTAHVNALLDSLSPSEEGIVPPARLVASRNLFEQSTRAVARAFRATLAETTKALDRHAEATARLEAARGPSCEPWNTM